MVNNHVDAQRTHKTSNMKDRLCLCKMAVLSISTKWLWLCPAHLQKAAHAEMTPTAQTCDTWLLQLQMSYLPP